MFDRIEIVKGRTEYVPYEKTVHKYRAPTDDSIRLYEEIKGKAYKSIIDSVDVTDNTLSYKAKIVKEDFSYRTFCMWKASINGVEYSGKEDVSSFGEKYTIPQIREKVVKAISDNIAKQILKSIYQEVIKEAM